MSERKIGYRDVLKQTEYMKIILAALINRFGDSIDAIASSWIVYELTGNAVWSAIMFGVNKIPTVVITPLAGAWVEGRKKKNIMIVTDIIRALCVAFIATGYLLEFLQPWMLVLTTFTISTVEAFRGPASTALTPKVLKKEYYSRGMALMSTTSSIVELIGTAMAAGIIALIGTAGAIYIDMVTFLLSALIIVFVKAKEEKQEKIKFDGKEYCQTLRSGFQYVSKAPIICFFMVVCIFLNAILVPLNSLQAPMAEEILGAGAEMLSVVGIAATVGMLLGSIVYPKMEELLGGRKVLVLASIAIAVFYIGIPVCQPFYFNKMFAYCFAASVTTLLGCATSVASMYMNVILVREVDESYLARVASITSAASSAAIPIVSFVVSAVVATVSTVPMFILSGLCALIAGVYFLFTKHMSEKKEEIESEVEAVS